MKKRREHVIEEVKRKLLRRGSPRLVVSLILMVTGLAGFLTSFALLHSGMTRMWLRYPLAILFAYCVFLLLLRLWLYLQRPDHVGAADALDIIDLVDIPEGGGGGGGGSGSGNFQFSGAGGDASGAGSGGGWGQSAHASSASSGSGGGGGGGGLGGIDLDEGAFIVVAIAAVAAALIAVVYVVYVAPALLAEILVDGALVAGLYKEMKGLEQKHWLRSAVRRTLVPALVAALFFSIAGYALQRAAPKARSVGEVWQYVTKD